MPRAHIYFVGTAGSGKSTMTYAFSEWMKLNKYNSVLVNLDPGADELRYVPDVDVREIITLSEVMERFGLGPNGAQIACADYVAIHSHEIGKQLEEYDTDYVLIDTPGQIELFAFREASRFFVEKIGGDESVIAFLIDPMMAKTPEGIISSLTLSATVQFRFLSPVINILSKSDLLSESEVERIKMWASDPYRLYNDMISAELSSEAVVSMEYLKALENIGTTKRIIPISSEEMFGFEDLYNDIQQTFMGGEDLERS